jgi:hypothetical protein
MMIEKETAKLIEIYESKKAKKAIYSQCNANQCWNPDLNLTYQGSSCRC